MGEMVQGGGERTKFTSLIFHNLIVLLIPPFAAHIFFFVEFAFYDLGNRNDWVPLLILTIIVTNIKHEKIEMY